MTETRRNAIMAALGLIREAGLFSAHLLHDEDVEAAESVGLLADWVDKARLELGLLKAADGRPEDDMEG